MEQGIKILLIEDNLGDVRLFTEMLKDISADGFHIDHVSSLETLHTYHPTEIDVILMDLNLPDSAGIETFTAVFSRFPQAPIIALTGLNDESLAYEVVKLGAQDYLLKDNLDPHTLARSIRYSIERKKAESHKDEFIGIASHELKTPVTSIKAYITVLERLIAKSTDPDPKAGEIASRIQVQVDKLTHLINDLLDVTKMQTGKMSFERQTFSIKTLIHDAIATMQPTTAQHSIEEGTVEDAYVLGDRDRTEQVLINLLSNSIKYSPAADRVIVSATNVGNFVRVSVQDFGIGIAGPYKQKVFERFYRGEDNRNETYPGLGLGLYISSEIIRRQNGSMRVDSEPGVGSTFSVDLPLAKPDGAQT